MRRLRGADIARAFSQRALPIRDLDHAGHVRPRDLLDALKSEFDHELRYAAAEALANERPELAAKHGLSATQVAVVIVAGAGIAAAMVFFGSAAFHVASLAMSLLFLMVISLRILAIGRPPVAEKPAPLGDDSLPIYTVLVPLFREAPVVAQILRSLSRLDYPAFGSKRTN